MRPRSTPPAHTSPITPTSHPAQLLSFHVAKGLVPASAVKNGAKLATLLPKADLTVMVSVIHVRPVTPDLG